MNIVRNEETTETPRSRLNLKYCLLLFWLPASVRAWLLSTRCRLDGCDVVLLESLLLLELLVQRFSVILHRFILYSN